MITFDQVAIRRGPKLLVTDASFCIQQNDKVAITGRNGCGKSSALALLQGELEPDAGAIKLPKGILIAHVRQEVPHTETTALDYTLQGDKKLCELRQQIDDAQTQNEHALPALYEQLEHIDGYSADSRAHTLLHGLGFSPEQVAQPVNHFSGGWKVRLNLAQALMCRSDLLLLDEPTNHLDLNTVLWLQQWLARYQGTMVLISHDRNFLDACVNTVIHIEQQTMKRYPGNYSAFEQQRVMQLVQQQALYEKQQQDIAHMESFIRRFKAKATKAKQAQSRVKTLQKLQTVAAIHSDNPFRFSFSADKTLPHQLLSLKKATLGYDETAILQAVNLSLQAGDRIGLLGANGAGKSTLIKTLAGSLKPLTGKYKTANGITVGYFAQHQLDQLHPEHTPLEHMRQQNPNTQGQELRNYLGHFGFVGDKVNEVTQSFSGGEKSRLALALLAFKNPAVLLLDEPTNHLDLEMRQALSLALQTYTGALVIISHDSHLLQSVADTLFLVQDQAVVPFAGDLDDYAKQVAQADKQTPKKTPKKATATTLNEAADASLDAKALRQQKAEDRKKRYPLTKQLKRLGKALDSLDEKKQAMEAQFAESDLYTEENRSTLEQLQKDKAWLDLEITEVEHAWLQAQEELDALM